MPLGMKRIGRAFVRRAALLALIGLTAAPSIGKADDCCRFELRVRRQAVLSETFDVELYAHFPDSGYALAGAVLDIMSSGVTWTRAELCGPAGPHPALSPGVIDGAGVFGIQVGQLPPALGFDPDTSNPILIWCGEFESNCRAPGVQQIWTEQPRLSYFPDASSTSAVECEPVRNALRSVLCGPLVIDDWIAVPAPGTLGEVVRETLVLSPERAGDPVGATLSADGDFSWNPVGAVIDVGGMKSGATLELTWFPWIRCWPILEPWLSLGATKKGEDLIVEPDFSGAGISTIPLMAYRDGKLVGEGVVPTGGSFALHKFCSSLTWCYELNAFDQLVLVLKCDDWFELSLPGQPVMEVDRIELAPRGTTAGFGSVDRLEVAASGLEKLVVLDFGEPDADCYPDCDQSGGLDFFDFLCFQKAFAAGDRYADCDESGDLDFFDFLCFQNAFAATCP